MKKIIWMLLFYIAVAQFAFAQPGELNGKIKFEWGDEFNGTTLNTDIWEASDNFDNNADGDGGGCFGKKRMGKRWLFELQSGKRNLLLPRR